MNYIIRYTSLAFIFLALHTTCIVLHPVYAQNAALSIYPPLIESVIKPGKSILIAYTIANEGDPVILSSGVSSFITSGIEGNVHLSDSLEGPVRFNLENSDIQLGKSFLLKSKQKKQLLLKIRIPEGATEGDYYYTFYVRTDTSESLGSNTNAHAQLTLGAHILISVTQSGKLEIRGSILKFDMQPDIHFSLFGQKWNIVDSSNFLPIDLIIHNDGKNVFKSDGDISIKGPLGQVTKYPLHPQNILVDSSRILEASSEAMLDCANSSLKACSAKHTIVLHGFFVGKHTITANLTFGPEQKTAILSFIGIPFKFILALVSTIAMVLVSIKLVKRQGINER